jgi:hypothetical protein
MGGLMLLDADEIDWCWETGDAGLESDLVQLNGGENGAAWGGFLVISQKVPFEFLQNGPDKESPKSPQYLNDKPWYKGYGCSKASTGWERAAIFNTLYSILHQFSTWFKWNKINKLCIIIYYSIARTGATVRTREWCCWIDERMVLLNGWMREWCCWMDEWENGAVERMN